MISPFIKKDFLTIIRNRHELLLLLGMPLVLITILGFALGGFINGGTSSISAKVAIIDHSDEQEDVERFIEKVKSMHLPAEVNKKIIEGAEQLRPIQILTEEIFGSEELKDIIELERVSPGEAKQLKDGNTYAAVIEIPKRFTYNVLTSIFFEEEIKPQLLLYKNEGRQISPKVVEDVLEQFQRQFSAMTVVGMSGLDPKSVFQAAEGTIDTVSKKEPINSMQYYTVGMSVMFIMFIASTMGSFAYREKRMYVFHRILLTNVSRWYYFSGIFLSTMLIALLQQLFLYGVSAVVFQVRWDHLSAFFLVNTSLSFAMGGLASLLTAINYRMNTETASNFFGSIIVALFALLGGSFTPIGGLSPVLNVLGNLTPNGAGMTALLKLLQGYGWQEIFHHVVYLVIFGVIMLAVAVISFPKRGDAV